MCEEISKISSHMHMPCDDSHVELNEVYDVMDKSIETPPETFCQENEVKNCPDITKSKMTLVDMDIPVITKGETIFVEIQQLFAYSGIDIQVKKNSWKYVDNCLRNNNIRVPDAFIKEDAKRTHINLTALAVLLGEIRSGLTERKATLLADIQSELHKLAARSIQVTSKMSPFQEHIQMSKTKKNQLLIISELAKQDFTEKDIVQLVETCTKSSKSTANIYRCIQFQDKISSICWTILVAVGF